MIITENINILMNNFWKSYLKKTVDNNILNLKSDTITTSDLELKNYIMLTMILKIRYVCE